MVPVLVYVVSVLRNFWNLSAGKVFLYWCLASFLGGAVGTVFIFLCAAIFNISVQTPEWAELKSSEEAKSKSSEGATWKEFRSSEGAFSVLMPGTPEESTETLSTEIGPLNLHSFTVNQRERSYGVVYADYPEALVQNTDPEGILDGARDGAVAKVQGKLLSESFIDLDNHPGREIKVESSDRTATLRARVYLVNNRLYQTVWAGPKEDSSSEEVDRFLDSFELTNG